MKAAVIQFLGSNCDRDMVTALEKISGHPVQMVWHEETSLPSVDIIALPGGFSYGDYLRCGAMAARAPVMMAVKRHIDRGGLVLGVCNGFQILCEARLLPGVLLRNKTLSFICKSVSLTVANKNTPFTNKCPDTITLPIAHHDGNYYLDDKGLMALKDHGQIVFTYQDNPNGAAADIAGIVDKGGRVLGMMPHPERAIDNSISLGNDGVSIIESMIEYIA
jgi:phosphoribosylformylglycinamidine synthase subunit PurQ / glutaminase